MKIYTKTGDKGQTSLFGGTRVSKANLRIGANGTVDELNSLIGVVIALGHDTKDIVDKTLLEIQVDLFEIGFALAIPTGGTKRQTISNKNFNKRVEKFESLIDKMTESLPELFNFILPGGGSIGSHLHLARSVARRAEREIIALHEQEKVDESIIRYFNRLSDLLFTMARFVNNQEEKEEVIWKSK